MLKSQRRNKKDSYQKWDWTVGLREENSFKNSNKSQIYWWPYFNKASISIKVKLVIRAKNPGTLKQTCKIPTTVAEQNQHPGRSFISTASLYIDKWRTDTVDWSILIIKKNSITEKCYYKKTHKGKGRTSQ